MKCILRRRNAPRNVSSSNGKTEHKSASETDGILMLGTPRTRTLVLEGRARMNVCSSTSDAQGCCRHLEARWMRISRLHGRSRMTPVRPQSQAANDLPVTPAPGETFPAARALSCVWRRSMPEHMFLCVRMFAITFCV